MWGDEEDWVSLGWIWRSNLELFAQYAVHFNESVLTEDDWMALEHGVKGTDSLGVKR